MSRKRLAYLLVALFAVLLAGGAYLLLLKQPTTPQTVSKQDLIEHYSYDKSILLEPTTTLVGEEENYLVYSLSYTSINNERVPALLLVPKKGEKHPAVIAVHGLGGDKTKLMSYMQDLANHGYVVLSLDLPKHGDRASSPIRLEKDVSYIFDQGVVDVRRAVDYLESRGDVSSIGLLGRSMGGMISSVVLGVEDRIDAAVLISTGGDVELVFTKGALGQDPKLKKVLESERRPYTEPLNYIGMYQGAIQFHFGLNDPIFPKESCQKLYDTATCEKEVYWYEAGHSIPEEWVIDRVLSFFDQHLK